MVSINTNLSSLIAQSSLKNSTNILNQAVERMTTGYKINHASDNAANYSISTNMQTQINSYDVVADNVAMGMDLVSTAMDVISNMQDKASRLQALCTQARNGTYGAQSMAAINTEAAAIMAEINRLYSTAEYNNISLFNRKPYEIADHLPKAGASGFIEEPITTYALRSGSGSSADYGDFIANPETYTDEEVADMTRVKDVSVFVEYESYSIYTVAELEKLRNYVNAGNDTINVEFVLGADIDLSSISNWTPIGNESDLFCGLFDGNGHVIKNLTIDNQSEGYHGLFGSAKSGEIKNVGLEDVNIKSFSYAGGLVGATNSLISNCYATGNVTGNNNVGGLVGFINSSISNCYATVDVTGNNNVGGLAGQALCEISNSYSTGNVTGNVTVGGLAGMCNNISNSYSTGSVTGDGYVGGLVGGSGYISNSYATGDVSGSSIVGGLAGFAGDISNSYVTGNVTGNVTVGGLVGSSSGSRLSFTNCYTTAAVSGNSNVGGIIGYVEAASGTPTTLLLNNCSTYSTVNGQNNISSLFNANTDYTNTTFSLSNVQYIAQEGIEPIVTSTAGYDLSTVLTNVSQVEKKNISTNLLVGINGDSSCQIGFDTNFEFDLSAIGSDISSDSALACINVFLTLLSEKSTALGAVENRLQSAIESIEVNIENLTSSLSTIRDADMADVSSDYIRQQILQQAAATLMSTANQSPSIALQLI